MGKGKKKTSRKGTKAWRKNISNKELDYYIEKVAREERSGGPLDSVPDEDLFFVDKSSDVSLIKKTARCRGKVLKSDAILERQSLVPPLISTKTKSKRGKTPKTKVLAYVGEKQVKQGNAQETFDIWADDVHHESDGSKKKLNMKKVRSTECPAAAVEVDIAGCSFNPSFEEHQEALGLAVAQEMQKVYKQQLEPPPIPVMVPGVPVEEEDAFFLDVDDGAEVPGFGEEQDLETSRPVKIKKLTRADLNRKRRRKERMRADEEKVKRVKLNKDILRLPEIAEDLEKEQEEKDKERLRRMIGRKERESKGPPRLGKLRFQPAPLQVLLSDEVSGSLRKLKGCFNLVRDRYINLQRRGLIEPRQPTKKRARKKRIEYEQGSKGNLEREMHYARQEVNGA
ncbi:hypothetical protein KP509_07G089700 [Ceratopteris richardii]|uniref:Ribosome biogenesis protein NOP53 n=1 Tax=Ceratopteris richardii TaxID=49495 RepID=A0A8T2UK70_CERRI|nr:hypothetical protein KP509_07G089700 [Ceratopteris richardii]